MKKIIAANWKMHKTYEEAISYINELLKKTIDFERKDVLIYPPFLYICEVSKLLEKSNIKVGAQNVYYEKKGAFTGEISPVMVKSCKAEYVLIGHSERRHIFKESDELIRKKVISALEEGLKVMLCVGETLEERESQLTFKVIESQLKLALAGLEDEFYNIEIAYEPVWAIGTGKSANPEDASKIHSFIKDTLKDMANKDTDVRVLYGGSVNPQNAKEFLKAPNVDGLLVGGASLDPNTFLEIINAC
ncbi:MAG: triose-phosphate isomerase [Hydrogenobaculum sp.]|nr:MAG: triose-phosphate isomerase [Hydrogenobaculum sp.]